MDHAELILPLLIGFGLDLLIGDPHWIPHPVRIFGNMILFGEKKLNRGGSRKVKGTIMTIVLLAVVFILFWFLFRYLNKFDILHLIFASVFVFYGLANHSLIKEALKVIYILKRDGLEAGRKQLSFIVGRDTRDLTTNQIFIAVLETLSENLSDGVIAPLFFYFIGGVPAMFTYKMVNTLDSMVGYKNERFKDFGWFAARLDDWLNFIPARITAVLMVLSAFSFRGLLFIFKYARNHNSPNAGYPEAALAGILNCRLGGPGIYHGIVIEKPYIGENARRVSRKDVLKACLINFICTFLFISLLILIYFVPSFYLG